MSRGNDVNDWYTPEQIERLKQGFPRENSVRLTKEEEAVKLLLRWLLFVPLALIIGIYVPLKLVTRLLIFMVNVLVKFGNMIIDSLPERCKTEQP